MKDFLSSDQRLELLKLHRIERDGKIRDRIKSVLLSDDGWTYKAIAKVLFLDQETVSSYVNDYKSKNKLKNNSGGSQPRLSISETDALVVHIENTLYLDANEIRNYVGKTYGVHFSHSGIVSWLHKHKFSYKKPNRVPAKTDTKLQEDFKQRYADLKANLSDAEVILFGDGVHPTMETKVSSGWIRTGKHKEIKTTASRTRVNLVGAIHLDTLDILTKDYKTVNSESVIDFLTQLKATYSNKNKIHLIVDNGPYYTSKVVKEKAKELGIEMVYLPPYSPNLNPIERVWKVLNEVVRNNVFFKTATEFKQQIKLFFTEQWDELKPTLTSRINDYFQTLKIGTLG